MTASAKMFVELKALHINMERVPLEPNNPCSG